MNKNIKDFLETFSLEFTPRILTVLNNTVFKDKIEILLLNKFGRVHYDYILGKDDTRDYSCSFNHIISYGHSPLNALLGLCTKKHIKEEIKKEIHAIILLLM